MREQFEAWMKSEQWFHEDDFKWDESRNCYSEFGIHIAYKAYLSGAASLQAERDQLAAECAALNERMQKLIQIINNADNNYCMCGEAMETHGYGGCGHPTGMFDYHYNAWLEANNKTTATDRFLAEQRALGVESFIGRIEWILREYCNPYVTENIIDDMGKFATQLCNEVKV